MSIPVSNVSFGCLPGIFDIFVFMILTDFLFCLNSGIILKEWESKQKQTKKKKKELEKQFKRITALSAFAHENNSICLNRD